MSYKLAIFDMDGTILNTLTDLSNSLNYSLQKCGYPKRSLDEVRSFVGNGIRKLIERSVPDGLSTDKIDEVNTYFTAYYKEHCADTTAAYSGIDKLLHHLQDAGCLTAVVSNKSDDAVQDLCAKYFHGLFDIAVGARDGVKKKPSPDSVIEVLKLLNKEKSETVYIGDSEVDIQTAKNAGIDDIIVDWGFRSHDYLVSQGAKRIVSTPSEIEVIFHE